MKKLLIFVLVLVAVVFPAAAKTNLINFGYTVQSDFSNNDGMKARSIGVDFINMKGDTAGFYSQINPYFTTSLKYMDSVLKLSETDLLIVGSSFLFGYGGDLNFGSMGLILGGGLLVDLNYINDTIDYQFTILTGLGLGANFYFQPGEGNFILNAGVTFALTPWAFAFDEYDSIDYTNWGMTNANFNIGVGWRTGGIGSKNSKSSSSSGGSSGGSDW